MKEEQIEIMVGRFLGWKLPEDFNPDAGISFAPEFNIEYMAKQGKPPMRNEPTGTNLLNYAQAKAMIEYILPEDDEQLEKIKSLEKEIKELNIFIDANC